MTALKQERQPQPIPAWISDLFLRFSYIYRELWMHAYPEVEDIEMAKIEWTMSLCGFNEKVVHRAVEKCKLHYSKPPSIKEFYDLCMSELRYLRDEDGTKQITNQKRSAPSPILAEFMAKNPIKPDDPFRKIYDQYKGTKELGVKMIDEMKKQFKLGSRQSTPV